MAEQSQARAFGARFEGVARRLPRKAALVEDGRAIDYATLESTSRAIAARIESAAAGRSGFAALLCSRKATTVQAMVASLRCGRAYVPLDGGDPDERLGFVLRDGAPAVLLTDRTLAARARALAGANCAVVEIHGDERPDPSFALPGVAPDSLAYVLYTSGSTGSPKGVTQTQRGVMFFADAFVRRLSLREADRLSLLWTMSFAAANMPVYAGLLNGATVCAYDLRRDGIGGLAAWLDRERVSVIHAFPTVFRGLCATLPPGAKLRHVRVIDIGAEAAYTSDVATFREHTNDDAIFVNQLGASEADVIAQHVVAHGDPVPRGALLPIGRPTPGVEVRIRRDDGSDAAVDEAGAIVVCSAHVSPGYWKRPDLDAQFLPPDPRHPGRRCYVSGDRGRFDAEGRLHFLGRTGSRVKIRGHSVDLAEVEAALAATRGVARAAALAPIPAGAAEADRIVAYVTAASPADADGPALRRKLADRLPPYMLPSTFVFLDELPTTATGKVDRFALARLVPPDAGAHSETSPANDRKRRILAHFRDVLRSPHAGANDDFFALGGDSLLAVELLARIARTEGKALPAATLVASPTVEALARAIDASDGVPVEAVTLRAGGDLPRLWCVPGMVGDPIWYAPLLRHLDPRRPVAGLSLIRLEQRVSIVETAKHCVDAMLAVQPEGPYLVIGYSIGGMIAVEIARALAGRRAEVTFVGVIDTAAQNANGGYLDLTIPFWRLPRAHLGARARVRVSMRLRSVARAVVPGRASQRRGVMPRYVPGLQGAMGRHDLTPFDGAITVFRAVDPPSVADPQLGWGRYAMRGVTVVDIPGHHLNLIESWRAGVLGSRVATALDSVTQRDAEASRRSSDHPA